MSLDTTRWRLPGFVDYAAARGDQDEVYLASKGIAALRADRRPALAQQAKIEVHLFGDLGWGIVTGAVASVRPDGTVALKATLTTEGPEVLDAAWDLLLRNDPEAFGGAWIVEEMRAEGVVTVPRRWPRLLVERLRAEETLVVDDSRIDALLELVRDRSLGHATMTTPRECAAFTARALVRAFEQTPMVEEIFLGPEDLATRLEAIWSS
jgi:hypothetical protein